MGASKVKGIGVEPLESRAGKSTYGFQSTDLSCEGQRGSPVARVSQREWSFREGSVCPRSQSSSAVKHSQLRRLRRCASLAGETDRTATESVQSVFFPRVSYCHTTSLSW